MSWPVSDLGGADLALWVARAIKLDFVMRGQWPATETEFDPETHCNESSTKEWKCWLYFKPHEDWAQGGPLIESEKIDIQCANIAKHLESQGKVFDGPDSNHDIWRASIDDGHFQIGTLPLVAAMRALVMSVYGETVPGEAAK